jgi:hypothetical protein
MLLAAIYGCAYIAALAAFTAAQFGWHPPFIELWDSRSKVYFDFVCGLAALAAIGGVLILVPLEKLPRPARNVLVFSALLLTLFAFDGILDLSPLLSRDEIIEKALGSIGMGIGLGIFAGLLSSIVPETKKDKEELNKRHSRRQLPLVMIGVVLAGGLTLLLYPRARDDGSVRDFGQFTSGDSRLEIGINEGGLEPHEFAVIRVTESGRTNLLVLERDEWNDVLTLWGKAKTLRSDDWRVVGDTHDTAPPDYTSVSLLAGRGVRFILSSRHGATVRFDLDRKDFGRFDAACRRVGQTLTD